MTWMNPRSLRDGLRLLRIAMAPFACLMLAGCIDSVGPLLTDAKPVLGQQGRMQVFRLENGLASNPQIVTIRWDGAHYVSNEPAAQKKAPKKKAAKKPAPFTVHEFEGPDLIVQNGPDVNTNTYSYSLLRKVADGVYLVFGLDEKAIDEAMFAKFCTKVENVDCRLTTREGLFAVARASLAKSPAPTSLLVFLAEDKPKNTKQK